MPFSLPFGFWSSPSATAPTWVTPISQTAATTTSGAYTTNSIWQWIGDNQTPTAFITALAREDYGYDQQQLHWAHQQGAAMLAQQRAYERYQLSIYPSPWFSLVGQTRIARPAIITHQEQARRDEALYRRALAECNEQEAARILRLIYQRERDVAAQHFALMEQQQRQLEQQQQRDVAQTRARELLLEHLTPDQRDTFIKKGWFIVQGGRTKTAYRIRGDTLIANVDVIGGRHRLCAHARSGSVPMGDQLLAQKIMLELAEDDFLRIANRHVA